MHSYTVSVALFDFFPVILTVIGLAFLAGGIARRHAALAYFAWGAVLLIAFGGVSKASWKLIVATQQQHLAWLENLLFICLAPGFVVMAFSLFHARRAWQSGIAASQASYSINALYLWLAIPLVGGLAALLHYPDTRLWFFWLLAVTTVANATLLVQAILLSRHAGLRWPVACFVINFVATLALSGMARLPATEATAWMQEGVNISAQTILALGFWRLTRRM